MSRRQHRQVQRAVKAAEASTGLQFCVYLGDVKQSDPRSSAEKMFADAGLETKPAVLVVVAPAQRRVEIVTGPAARPRIDDLACERVVTQMTDRFVRGDLTGGIIAGMAVLAAEAGSGLAAAGDESLPDVVEGVADRQAPREAGDGELDPSLQARGGGSSATGSPSQKDDRTER